MTELDDLRHAVTERAQLIDDADQRVNERLVAAYEAGYTYREIGDVLSVTQEIVRRRLNALGVTPRPRGPNPGRAHGAT